MLTTLHRRVVLTRDQDGWWVAECPSLPGCVSQGETRDDAVANIKDAIALYLESLAAHGEQVPEDTAELVTV